jgi:hypothetical protein
MACSRANPFFLFIVFYCVTVLQYLQQNYTYRDCLLLPPSVYIVAATNLRLT